MTSTQYPVPPVNLKERIAALQQRGASPSPTPSPSEQPGTSSGVNSPPRGTLRDKIAKFEQKGGTPIPRGSFGLGAPPASVEDDAARRRGQLYGSRLTSLTKPLGPPPTRRSSTLSASGSLKQRAMSASFADSFDVMAYADSNSHPPSPSLTTIPGADEPPSPTIFAETSTFTPAPRRNSFTAVSTSEPPPEDGQPEESPVATKTDLSTSSSAVEEPLDPPSIVISHERENATTVQEAHSGNATSETVEEAAMSESPTSELAPNTSFAGARGETAEQHRAEASAIPTELPDEPAESEAGPVSPPSPSIGVLPTDPTHAPTEDSELPVLLQSPSPPLPSLPATPVVPHPAHQTSPTSLPSPPRSPTFPSAVEVTPMPAVQGPHASISVPSPDTRQGSFPSSPLRESAVIEEPEGMSQSPVSADTLRPKVSAPAITESLVSPTTPTSSMFVPKQGPKSFHATVYGKTTEIPGEISSQLAPPPHSRGTVVEPTSPSLNRELSALLAEAVQMEELLGLDTPSRELSALASSLSVPGLSATPEEGVSRFSGEDVPPTPPPKSPSARYSRFNSLRSLVGRQRTTSRHGISSSEDTPSSLHPPSSETVDLFSTTSSPPKRSVSGAGSLANRILKSPRTASHSESDYDAGSTHLGPPRSPSKRYSRASSSQVDLEDFPRVPDIDTASLMSKRSLLSLRKRSASPTPMSRHSKAPEPLRLALHEDEDETRETDSDWARSVLSFTGESES